MSSSNNSVDNDSSKSEITVSESVSKKLRFNCKVKVVLIPCIEEYRKENINSFIWWNSEDYRASYQDMILNDPKSIDITTAAEKLL